MPESVLHCPRDHQQGRSAGHAAPGPGVQARRDGTVNAEEAVIGACLLDQNVIREAVKYVMPSDFSFWQGEEIFSAIIALHSMRQPVDVLTVGAKLAGSRIPPTELHRLVEQVPTAANVAFYAEQVHEASIRRKLRAVGVK